MGIDGRRDDNVCGSGNLIGQGFPASVEQPPGDGEEGEFARLRDRALGFLLLVLLLLKDRVCGCLVLKEVHVGMAACKVLQVSYC